MDNPIEIRGLKKQLGDNFILNVDFLTAARGEIVNLTGENGSGKTTLLKLIAGLIKADSLTTFSILGTQQPSPPEVVYLHQTPRLLNRTVYENIAYGVKCCQLSIKNIDEALQWAGVDNLSHRLPHQLSGGEKSRVCLARIYALKPTLYLLDEPLAYLDAEGKAQIKKLAMTLSQNNATIIISSHEELDFPTTEWRLDAGRLAISSQR